MRDHHSLVCLKSLITKEILTSHYPFEDYITSRGCKCNYFKTTCIYSNFTFHHFGFWKGFPPGFVI